MSLTSSEGGKAEGGTEELRSPNNQEASMSNVNHPKHYNTNPSGVECIQVVEHMSVS